MALAHTGRAGTCALRVKVFILKKLQGAQILIFVGENWHEASFYIKKQTQKYKFEIWLLKTTILDPQKSAFLVFEEKPPIQIFSSCFGFDSGLKTIDAQMTFWSVFLKTHYKKLLAVKNAILTVFGSY